MRRAIVWVLLLSLALATAFGAALSQRAMTPRPDIRDTWVIGYYPGYLRDSYPVEAVGWESMTHLAIGMATPRPDGTLDGGFHIGDDGEEWACSVVEEAHRHATQTLLVVGGAHTGPSFRAAAAPSSRDRLAASIVALVDRCGFDGVDLDWEPLGRGDGESFLALARALRAARPQLTLTAALPPVNVNAPQEVLHPWIAQLPDVFDRLGIMTYGMNGNWGGWASWHSSPLGGDSPSTPMSVESSVDAYLRAGVPPHKLGVGIGFFGICMRGVSAPREHAPTMTLVGDDNTMSYSEIVRRYPGVEQWDPEARVPYRSSRSGVGPLGCTFISYENERSIAAKARLVQDKGLGGAIVWNLNQGHLAEAAPGATDPLLDAVGSAFLGASWHPGRR